MAAKFYHCNVCGNVLAAVVPSGIVPYCCDSEMTELTTHNVEGSSEYHVPEVSALEEHLIKVKVGRDFHPSTHDHHICFVVIETEEGATIRYLKPTDLPEVVIHCDGTPQAVYAYCNRHGLWRKKI